MDGNDVSKSEHDAALEKEVISDNSMELHFSTLKAKHSSLQEEKIKMEADFSVQRAKLKELYLQKEVELQLKTEENSANVLEIEALTKKLSQLQSKLDEARSQATIAHCTAENEIEVEKRKCKEEIASVQQILREKIEDLRLRLRISDQEAVYYRDLYEKYVEDAELKKEKLLSPSVLSAVTKSIAKRVPSLSPAHSPHSTLADRNTSTNASTSSLNSSLASLGLPIAAGGENSDNLEESMKRAQEDAAVLRSLVVPLEEEIRALKEKIREQDTQLRMHESQEQMAIKTSDVIAPLMQGKSPEELVQELDEKLQGVKYTLEAEKESRADLELYSVILNTQKTILANSVENMKAQLSELRQLYESERKDHLELKNTWQMANDQFLETQRKHLADLKRIRLIFTAEQLRKFNEMQHSDEKDGIELKVNKEPEKPYTEETSPPSSLLENTNETVSQEEKGSSDDTVSSLIDSSDDNENSELTDEGIVGKISTEVLISKYCPEKMPQLTDDQKKALSEIGERTGQSSLYLSGPDAGSSSYTPLSANQRIVSEYEWRQLQEECKDSRAKMTEACPLCARFEADLKKIQYDLKDSVKERIKLEKANARHIEDLDRESSYRKQAEAQWKQKAELSDKKVKDVQVAVEKVTKRHSQIVSWSRKKIIELDEKLKIVTKDRQKVHAELTRLQNENDDLVGKHSQHSQEMQNEIINLPDSMEEMQLLLLRYREELIAAKVAKEAVEDNYSSKVLFMKEQLLKEQHERTSLEHSLNEQNDFLRQQIRSLERRNVELEREKKLKAEAEEKLMEVERNSKASQLQSDHKISSLKTHVDELTQAKTKLETELSELRGKLSTLQHDLKMSEDVQRDFVRLSQSLQVQLEKIRQSEKEVRWQHEDDIDDCSNCKQRFTTMGRRKNHCRHCGKVFCSDCVTKTVTGGPNNRASRVCDVCHTLLVQDATPFFSKEPPVSPD